MLIEAENSARSPFQLHGHLSLHEKLFAYGNVLEMFTDQFLPNCYCLRFALWVCTRCSWNVLNKPSISLLDWYSDRFLLISKFIPHLEIRDSTPCRAWTAQAPVPSLLRDLKRHHFKNHHQPSAGLYRSCHYLQMTTYVRVVGWLMNSVRCAGKRLLQYILNYWVKPRKES
jgi:hypothetical protein